jgi:hypothetical protein
MIKVDTSWAIQASRHMRTSTVGAHIGDPEIYQNLIPNRLLRRVLKVKASHIAY